MILISPQQEMEEKIIHSFVYPINFCRKNKVLNKIIIFTLESESNKHQTLVSFSTIIYNNKKEIMRRLELENQTDKVMIEI